MTNILVIGGSQGIGAAVARAAAGRGHTVRAMSRRASQTTLASGVAKFQGDALVAENVARALEGIDVVVQALGLPTSLDLLTKPVTLFSAATRILLGEMQRAGINRLVSVTGFGAGDSRAHIHPFQRLPFELVLKRAYDDKSIQEELIEQSALDWLIVRPGVLTNCPLPGSYRVLSNPESWRNGIVAREDVADFIVQRIEQNRFNREKPVLIRIPI